MNPIFKYENDFSITSFDFASILYMEYDKQFSSTHIYFYDSERILRFSMDENDFMNLITKWKNWKVEMAEKTSQQIFLA